MKGRIKTLVKLLEDDDIHTSAHAMSEILSKDRVAWRVIGSLQESSSGVIRKKAHQMQFAAASRARRRKLAARMAQRNLNLLKGLVELHLQWFDEDSEEYVVGEWTRFKDLSRNWDANSIENISEMMTNLGVETTPFGDLECVDYCVGEISATGRGADFILCAMARILSREQGWDPSIVATDAGFCLFDEKRRVGLFPAKEWTCAKCQINDNIRRWSDSMLLNLAASSMFFCSVVGGQIRYSYMIGSCIAESMDAGNLADILPYPFGGEIPQGKASR